jgi:hypothetical protein
MVIGRTRLYTAPMIKYVAALHERPVEQLSSAGQSVLRTDGYVVAGFEYHDDEDHGLIAAFLRLSDIEYVRIPEAGYDGVTRAYDEDEVQAVGDGNFYRGARMILNAYVEANADDIVERDFRPFVQDDEL